MLRRDTAAETRLGGSPDSSPQHRRRGAGAITLEAGDSGSDAGGSTGYLSDDDGGGGGGGGGGDDSDSDGGELAVVVQQLMFEKQRMEQEKRDMERCATPTPTPFYTIPR